MTEFVSRRALEERCRLPGLAALRPDPEQGLTAVRRLLKRGWDGEGGPVRLGRAESVLVLGLDAISYELAARLWSPDSLVPLTSTFPSTSVVAWLSTMTGLGVEGHEVPGVVYYEGGAGGLFHCFRDFVLESGWDWSKTVPASAVRFGPWPTFFDDARGAERVAHAGDLVNWAGRWCDAILHGAEVRNPRVDWAEIRFDPGRIIEWAVGEVEATVRGRRRGLPLLSFTMLNFDDYVHFHGYPRALEDALVRLEESVLRWKREGHTVVAVSDHGMIPNRVAPAVFDAWEEINGPRLCLRPVGGAGRVRWSYPRPGKEAEVHGRLAELLGGNALVVRRDELGGYGLLAVEGRVREALGEVVTVALGEEFPVPDPSYVYEHGSVTPAEMLVFLSVWEGD